MSMSGFVSTVEDWDKLENSLDRFLTDNGVVVLHAKQFHDSDAPFLRWQKSKKHQFADDLFKLVAGRIGGISFAVRRADLAETKSELQKFHSMSPIGLCFGLIMQQLVMKLHPMSVEQGLSFLVESGNANNAEIEQYFHKLSEFEALKPALKAISFVKKESCRAIQIADFLAFYARRRMKIFNQVNGNLLLPPCPYIEIMERHVPIYMRLIRGQPKFPGLSITNVSDLAELKALLKSSKS